MNRRIAYLVVAALVLTVAAALWSWGQQSRDDATIEDLYRLLTTEEGRNRLDVLEEWLADIDEEVDVIHSVAEKMLEDQYGFFDQQEWSLDDLKFQLNSIEAMIQDLKDCLVCP